MTANDIIDYLEDLGITAERRSVYRDIYALRDIFGMDIEGGQGGRFKLMSRQFDFEELQLIAECIYASKFISEDKAKKLIDTLTEFCSEPQGELLPEQVYMVDRVKTTNETTLRMISTIRKAMSKKENGQRRIPTKMKFRYLHYRITDKVEQKEGWGGEFYILNAIYPVSIVLIVLGLLHEKIKKNRYIYPFTVLGTAVVSVLAAIDGLGVNMGVVSTICHSLPLHSLGFGWTSVTAAMLATSLIADRVKKIIKNSRSDSGCFFMYLNVCLI